jgi:hypothetical protein
MRVTDRIKPGTKLHCMVQRVDGNVPMVARNAFKKSALQNSVSIYAPQARYPTLGLLTTPLKETLVKPTPQGAQTL